MHEKIKNIAKKVSTILIWTVFGIVLLLTLWVAFDKFILKSPVPSVFGYSTLTIETGSMNGTSILIENKDPVEVNIGDLILIKKTNDYKIGDVITFIHEGEKIPTTHRIIRITEEGFITKGDANNAEDSLPVLEEEILGEVVGHYPKLGKFCSWVREVGWIYIVVALLIIAIGSFLIKLFDDNNSQNKEECVTKEDENKGGSINE